MKKNITINMFGQLYAIDEDAYELLKRYLNGMKHYFSDKEGGEEITDDIEHRVAELLWQQNENGAVAINIDIVKDIIGKIGNPTEIDSNDSHGSSEEETETDNNGDTVEEVEVKHGTNLFGWLKGRYLYRDPNDKVLGGICSGMAQFTGKSSSLGWRLGTILAIFVLMGISEWFHFQFVWAIPVLYIIMWFIVPLPYTPEDRLRMKGQDVTPENINEDIINESVNGTKEEYRPKRNSNGCLTMMLKLAIVVCLLPFFFALAIGMFCLVVIIMMILGLSTAMFPYWSTGSLSWFPDFVNGNAATLIMAIVASLVVIGLPIFYLARVLRGNGRKMSTGAIITCIILWLLSLTIAVLSIISAGMTWSKAEDDYLRQVDQTDKIDRDTTTVAPLPTGSSAVDTIGWQN